MMGSQKIILSVIGAACLCQAVAQDASTPVFRKTPTHAQLAAKAAKAQDPMKSLPTSQQTHDPSNALHASSLLQRSEIISFAGLATLVPKRSILSKPTRYEDRCRMQEGARIVPWREFLVKNRGWIRTVEVSVDQATGKKQITDDMNELNQKATMLVVATYQGGPISVVETKPDGQKSDKH